MAAEVEVRRDGSGVVRAGVGFDDEALARLGDPAERVLSSDLREAGWFVEGPRQEGDGLTWIRVSRPFSTPEEGSRLAGRLSAPDGPLRDLVVSRTASPWSATTAFSGSVDLTQGLTGLLDPAAAELLGTDLGLGLTELRERFGDALDAAVSIEVTALLPGGERRSWRGMLGEETVLFLESHHWNLGFIVPASLSMGLAALALGVVAWRRRR